MHKLEFESKQYRVVVSIANFLDPTCVVCFHNWDRPQGKRIIPFAQGFLENNKINGIYVLPDTNDWFTGSEINDILDQIKGVISKFSNIVTYGSSMGGYAAIRYANALHAKRAIAVSPQYSINKEIVPHENRWEDERDLVNFKFENNNFTLTNSSEYYILIDTIKYDFAYDFPHAKLYENHGQIKIVPFPFSGHPSHLFLNDIGLVGEFSLALIRNDTAKVNEFRRSIRSLRKNSRTYWTHRGYALSIRDPEAAKLCFLRALETGADPAYIEQASHKLPELLRNELLLKS